jgi:predicted RNA-binding protein YlqC (UPF0109 family)
MEEDMRNHSIFGLVAAAIMVISAPVAAAKPPQEWDGLQRVKSKKFDSLYLLPGADFRPYTKVMLDPPQAAFRKGWQRDMNDTRGLDRHISDADAEKMLIEAKAGLGDAFTEAYQGAGFQVVTTPGPDTLAVTTAAIDLYVNAPDQMSATRVRTYSSEAGEATIAIEVRDSTTGKVLGRAVDGRIVGDSLVYRRTSVSNRSDFNQVFSRWAKTSADGLAKLKEMSPVDTTGTPAKK